MEIKICGITNANDVSYLNKEKVDYAGFVFFEKSKRNVTLQEAKTLRQQLDASIASVAVMVSPTPQEIVEKQEAGFSYLQIHGKLTEDVLEIADVPVWYAINIDDAKEVEEKSRWFAGLSESLQDKIAAVVVDAKEFGSGKTFDWQKAKEVKKQPIFQDRKFILAGGLHPQNVTQGIEIFQPDVVDVSSGVEISKEATGKDEEKIKAFVNAVRSLG